MDKFTSEHIGVSVYSAKYGKGIIVAVENRCVSVEHRDIYARYSAIDGKKANGQTLHFFQRRVITEEDGETIKKGSLWK